MHIATDAHTYMMHKGWTLHRRRCPLAWKLAEIDDQKRFYERAAGCMRCLCVGPIGSHGVPPSSLTADACAGVQAGTQTGWR